MRYSQGVTPEICLNTRLKFRTLPKPHRSPISVILSVESFNRRQAASKRNKWSSFLAKAPENVVAMEKEKLEKYKATKASLEAELAKLG